MANEPSKPNKNNNKNNNNNNNKPSSTRSFDELIASQRRDRPTIATQYGSVSCNYEDLPSRATTPMTVLSGSDDSGSDNESFGYSYRQTVVRKKKRQEAVKSMQSLQQLTLTQCGLFVVVYFIVAVAAFHMYLQPNWTMIDAVYFAVVTATTVGTGDLVPESTAGRCFTCFFAVSGVSCLGLILGVIGSRLLDAQERSVQRASDRRARRAMELFGGGKSARQRKSPAETTTTTPQSPWARLISELGLVAVLLVLFSALLLNDPGIKQRETSNILDRFFDALYYTVISATTVGYGDVHPTTQLGRLFCVFFITVSVAAMGHWMSLVAGFILEHRKSTFAAHFSKKELTESDLLVMDDNGDGEVSQLEFVEFMLLAMNKVDKHTFDELRFHFHRLDRDGNGSLSKDDLLAPSDNHDMRREVA